MPILSDIIEAIEQVAPIALQESYDNSGLLVGNSSMQINKAILCLDCLESVVDEAIEEKANLIIAHHPIIFSGIKKLNGKNYIERVILKAIKHDIAIYAAHTNLDNVRSGVNAKIAEKLNLQQISILSPTPQSIKHLFVYVPFNHAEKVRNALFEAGAGSIGEYSHCSYNLEGKGTFMASEKANPFVGNKNEVHEELEQKIEVVFPNHLEINILNSLKNSHPYEEIAFGIVQLTSSNKETGAGMIGEFTEAKSKKDFLQYVKSSLKTDCIRYSKDGPETIKRVAICGGAGSFLLKQAIASKADAFITGDFKYHDFFDNENKLVIADIGHYESEQFTTEIFIEILSKKFTNFAFQITSVNTNPIQYY